jgi:hypothetical protein
METSMKKFEHHDHGIPPRSRIVMKEYDLSDRKLKIAVVLAIAIIAWLCLKGGGNSHARMTPPVESFTTGNSATTAASAGGAVVTGS